MESLKDVHQSVCDTLRQWNYEQTDMVHLTDLVYAIYHSVGKMSPMCKYHVVCMCCDECIIDYGDGVYGINEESDT